MDLANWVLKRDPITTGVAPMPNFWIPTRGVPHDTREAVWHWGLDHYAPISQAIDGVSAAPNDLLHQAIELAIENSTFDTVVARLLRRGADVKTVLPPTPPVNISGPFSSLVVVAAQSGGNVLHAAVIMMVERNGNTPQSNVHARQRFHNFSLL